MIIAVLSVYIIKMELERKKSDYVEGFLSWKVLQNDFIFFNCTKFNLGVLTYITNNQLMVRTLILTDELLSLSQVRWSQSRHNINQIISKLKTLIEGLFGYFVSPLQITLYGWFEMRCIF